MDCPRRGPPPLDNERTSEWLGGSALRPGSLNAYTSQKKGAASERVLDLVDGDTVEGVVIPDSIQYTVTQDEHRVFPEDSLICRRIEFAVRGFPQFDGRTVLRGKILADQFPGKPRDLTKNGKCVTSGQALPPSVRGPWAEVKASTTSAVPPICRREGGPV